MKKSIYISLSMCISAILLGCSAVPSQEKHAGIAQTTHAVHSFSEPVEDILKRDGNVIVSQNPPRLLRATADGVVTALTLQSKSHIEADKITETLPEGLLERLKGNGWRQVDSLVGQNVAKLCYLKVDQDAHVFCMTDGNHHIAGTDAIGPHFNGAIALLNSTEKKLSLN